jgi:hypothetical protein
LEWFWGCLEEKHKKRQPGRPVSALRYETETSQGLSNIANLTTTLITRCRNSDGVAMDLQRRRNLTFPNVSRLSGYFILRVFWCSLLCLPCLLFIPGATFSSHVLNMYRNWLFVR